MPTVTAKAAPALSAPAAKVPTIGMSLRVSRKPYLRHAVGLTDVQKHFHRLLRLALNLGLKCESAACGPLNQRRPVAVGFPAVTTRRAKPIIDAGRSGGGTVTGLGRLPRPLSSVLRAVGRLASGEPGVLWYCSIWF
jgi:hypothetical protein